MIISIVISARSNKSEEFTEKRIDKEKRKNKSEEELELRRRNGIKCEKAGKSKNCLLHNKQFRNQALLLTKFKK